MIQKIKGTQDFLELSLKQFITNSISEHLNLHNFNQIELPILEPVEVFKRTVGEETDIVNKEMFMIEKREGSKENICLRPEATAQTMRAFLENSIQALPWKVYSFGPMFRYERPQKGRYRQFHQCNIEIINSPALDYDVSLISALDALFSAKLKMIDYALVINFLGCPQDRVNFREELTVFLSKKSICETCQKRAITNPLRVFDCKNDACQKIYLQAPIITDSLCKECNDEWQQVQTNLSLLGVSYAVKPSLVRGLDYYNKTVFEFTSAALGAQSAFCGGGRYELATQIGSKNEVPAIGAAIGIERLMLILESKLDQLPVSKKPSLSVIVPLSPTQNSLALLVAQSLYNKNICADIILDDASVKSKMRKANKMGASYCILIGEEEQANSTATVKNMQTGEEQTVAQIDIIKIIG